MTGVMPLPAVRNSTLRGPLVAAGTKSPAAWSSWTIVPGCARRTRWLLTLPSGIALTVIVMRPSVPAGVGGQRVGAPLADAVDVDADAGRTGRACGRASPGRA